MIYTEKCATCEYYKQAYEKGVFRYWKKNGKMRALHYCTKLDRFVTGDFGCEYQKKRVDDIDLSAQRFEEAARDIQSILQSVKNIDA